MLTNPKMKIITKSEYLINDMINDLIKTNFNSV